jgi:hypothetical protein
MELTIEQKKALALASARKRAAEAGGNAVTAAQSPEMQQANAELSALTQAANPAVGDRMAFDALPAWKKPLVAATDMAQLAATGGSMGFVNKAAAGVRAPFTDKTYEEELDALKQSDQRARNRSGTAGMAAEIGGSVLTAGGLAKNGLTLAGRGGTAAMTGLKGLAARAGLMGLEGEAFNKVSSMGYDQEYVPGLGVAAGAGGQVAGEGLSAGLTKIGKAVGNYMAPAETRAAQEIFDAAQTVNPQAALAQLNDLGPDAMAVDVLGERGIALGRRAANLSPDARETIESAVLGRKSMQNQRVVADLEKAAGLPVGNRMNVDALKKEAYDQVSPQINAAYEAARKAGYDLPREPFRSVLESPLGKEAYQNAEGALLNRAGASGQTSASELARLDQTKRFLDSAAKKAFRAGDDDLGSQAAALAKALRDQMDASIAGPEYAAARALRQQAYGTEGAFDLGETLASGRVPFGLPEQAGKVAAGDKAALAKGYAAKQAENLLNRGSTEGALNQLSTPMGREGFIAALGEKAPEIIKALGREKAFNRVAKGISGNSTTARQVAEMMGTGVGSAAAAGAMGYDMTTGGTMGLLAALLKKGGPALQRKFASDASRQVAPHLADLLTRKALPASRPIAATAIEKLSEGSKQALVRALMMSGVLAGSQAGQP